MPRRRWTSQFKDLRGRWVDNRKLVRQIIADARAGEDWTLRLRNFLATDSEKAVPKGNPYDLPPDLRNFTLDEQDLSSASFRYANLSRATAYRCDGSQIDCSNSILTQTKWGSSKFDSANFSSCKGYRCYFGHCDLTNASFDSSNLRYASFRNANLTCCSFKNADLRFANLTEALCDGADFSGAKLYGASLWQIRYTTLNADQIDISAEGDGSVLTCNLRLAPMFSLLTQVPRLSEVIHELKLNTVVILGRDSTAPSLELLKQIGKVITEQSLIPVIVKQLPDIGGEPFLKKATLYSLLARFILVENSNASGHLIELERILNAGCIVGVLQQNKCGSSYLTEEYFTRFPNNLKRFWYSRDEIENQTAEALQWCETARIDMARALAESNRNLDIDYLADPPEEIS